jgi:hypothetical protein
VRKLCLRKANRVLAIAISALTLVGCGSASIADDTSRPSGTTAPVASATLSTAGDSPESPGPDTMVGPTPTLQTMIAVRVSVATLNVRDAPTTGASTRGKMSEGDLAILRGFGAIRADGYVWYQASRISGLRGELPALPSDLLEGEFDLSGWIAVGDGSTTYATPLPARCPSATDLVSLSPMLPGEQLSCFGAETLELEGTFGCGDCGGYVPGYFLPLWLAHPIALGLLSADPEIRLGDLVLHFPPDVSEPAVGSIIRVGGHFDDPRASSCSISTVEGSDLAEPVPIPSADAAQYCRQQFVVETYDVLGINPSFPPR